MGIPVLRGARPAFTASCALTRLLARSSFPLARLFVALPLARRKAVRGFRRGLAEMGLAPDVIDQLSREYPSLDLKSVLSARGEGATPPDGPDP